MARRPALVFRLLPAPRLGGDARRRTRDDPRARRPPERPRLAARRPDARGVDAGASGCCGSSPTARWSSTPTSPASPTGRCNDMVVASDGNAYVGNFGFEVFVRGTAPERDARARAARRHGRGGRRRHGVPERECDHSGRSHVDRRRDVRSALHGVRHPSRRHARESAGLGAARRHRARRLHARRRRCDLGGQRVSAPTSHACAKAARSPIASTSGRARTRARSVVTTAARCSSSPPTARDEKIRSPEGHRCDPHDAGRRSPRRAAVTERRTRRRRVAPRVRGVGVPCAAASREDDAAVAAELLVEADLIGFDTHGIAHLVGAPRIRARAARRPRAGRAHRSKSCARSVATALVDGHGALGHGHGRPRDRPGDRRRRGDAGIGAVAVREGRHFGAASLYALRIADAGHDRHRHDERVALGRAHVRSRADARNEPDRGRRADRRRSAVRVRREHEHDRVRPGRACAAHPRIARARVGRRRRGAAHARSRRRRRRRAGSRRSAARRKARRTRGTRSSASVDVLTGILTRYGVEQVVARAHDTSRAHVRRAACGRLRRPGRLPPRPPRDARRPPRARRRWTAPSACSCPGTARRRRAATVTRTGCRCRVSCSTSSTRSPRELGIAPLARERGRAPTMRVRVDRSRGTRRPRSRPRRRGRRGASRRAPRSAPSR